MALSARDYGNTKIAYTQQGELKVSSLQKSILKFAT